MALLSLAVAGVIHPWLQAGEVGRRGGGGADVPAASVEQQGAGFGIVGGAKHGPQLGLAAGLIIPGTPRALSDITKLDLLNDEEPARISAIWEAFHDAQPNVAGDGRTELVVVEGALLVVQAPAPSSWDLAPAPTARGDHLANPRYKPLYCSTPSQLPSRARSTRQKVRPAYLPKFKTVKLS